MSGGKRGRRRKIKKERKRAEINETDIEAETVKQLKGYATFFFFLLFSSLLSSRQEDRSHSFNCVCSNKEETGRARPPLISLAQTLVVNGKC